MPSPIRSHNISQESLRTTDADLEPLSGVENGQNGETTNGLQLDGTSRLIRARNPLSAAEDVTLLRAVAQKEEQALVKLYRKYARLVFSLSYRILKHEGEAEECAQEVFLQIWQKASLYDVARGTFEAWLSTLTHHRAIDILRTKRFRQRSAETKFDAQDLNGLNSDAFTLDRTGLTISIEQDERSRVSDAMSQIPPEQKQVLELAYYQGYSQSEIAEKLELPLGTVKTRMRQGMIRLSKFVKDLRYGGELNEK